MGIDVELYVEVDACPDDLVGLSGAFKDKSPGWLFGGALEYDDAAYLDRPRIEAPTGMRYFGPGYARGNWPKILAAICAMAELFPDRDVFYGGDSDENGMVVDAELLAEYSAAWLTTCRKRGWQRVSESAHHP